MEPTHANEIPPLSPFQRKLLLLALALVVLYAFLAALQGVRDPDAGWQLAMGRYVVQHHQVPTTDVLSYTARGSEWIYPPFGGALFYLVFAAGGWKALSWACAAICAVVVAVLLIRRSAFTAAVLAAGIPLIADRMSPRGDIFTTVFFTIYLLLLSRPEISRRRLWLFPALMLAWVNCHPGFVIGLAMLAAYLLWQSLFATLAADPRSRSNAVALWPWALASLAVTLINPWGPRIYLAIFRQQQAMKVHAAFIGEWGGVPLTWRMLTQATTLYGLSLCIAIAALVLAAIALWRRRFGCALLALAAAYFMVHNLRWQPMCVIAIAVVFGEVYAELPGPRTASLRTAAAVVASLLCLAGMVNCVSNQFYVFNAMSSHFGPGESWAFPERAAAFIEREHLPGNLFHEYNTGGFLSLRLGPAYPDFIDGRAIPFGTRLFVEQAVMLKQPPDSQLWQQYADYHGINVLVFSLARFGGLGSVDLAGFCRSQAWRPVYLDDVSIVLLRNTPQNRAFIERDAIDCAHQPLVPPADASSIDQFNFYSNAAGILYLLGRDAEASADLDRAAAFFPNDPNLHLTRAQLFAAQGRSADAEAEFRRSLQLKQTDTAWFAFANFLIGASRMTEARDAMKASSQLSPNPQNALRSEGFLSLVLQDPRAALASFDAAERSNPYHGETEMLGLEFNAQLAQGRAEAWRQLGDLNKAITHQEAAVRATPGAQKRWVDLARLYQAAGRSAEAQRAMQQAQQLSQPRQ